MNAGRAHGISRCSRFTVFGQGDGQPIRFTTKPSSVNHFTTVLDPPAKHVLGAFSGYAKERGACRKHRLTVFTTGHALFKECLMEGLARWICLTEDEYSADLHLSHQPDLWQSQFTLRKIPVFSSLIDLVYCLPSAALNRDSLPLTTRKMIHFRRFLLAGVDGGHIVVRYTVLQLDGDITGTPHRVPGPHGLCPMPQDGPWSVHPRVAYGLQIENQSQDALYLSVFYFNSDFEISTSRFVEPPSSPVHSFIMFRGVLSVRTIGWNRGESRSLHAPRRISAYRLRFEWHGSVSLQSTHSSSRKSSIFEDFLLHGAHRPVIRRFGLPWRLSIRSRRYLLREARPPGRSTFNFASWASGT